MNKLEIIEAIENFVSNYLACTIGITEDPKRGKSKHGNPMYWHEWKADSETIARNVEKHFLHKGMKNGGGLGDHPIFVYMF